MNKSKFLGNKLGTTLLVSCTIGSPSLAILAISINLLYLLELSIKPTVWPNEIGGVTVS